MNQRDEYRDNGRFERDRESNGGRGFQGFDDSRDRRYEAGPHGRERDWDRWRGSGAGRGLGGGVDEFSYGVGEGRQESTGAGTVVDHDSARRHFKRDVDRDQDTPIVSRNEGGLSRPPEVDGG